MSTINIYEYPTDEADLDEYRIAVMRASKDGLTTEIQERCVSDGRWERSERPHWNWVFYRYRIAAPKIAEGHNPNKLTEDQVGVKDGWRLLEADELYERPPTYDIQAWIRDEALWDEGYSGCLETETYRTKKPEGYFPPKPEQSLDNADKQACEYSLCNDHIITADTTLKSAFSCGWNAALKYERSRAK